MMDKLNKKIDDFLMNPHARIYRHMALQFIILLISINVLWDTPDELITTPERIKAWIGYFLVLDVIVYVNIYVCVPRFLLKDRMLVYLLSVLVIVILAVAAIVFMQDYVFNPGDLNEITQTTPEQPGQVPVLILGALSSSLAIILLVFGTSALLLFKHWMAYNQRISDLKSVTLQSELKLLKDQINPHFLFNMLNNANVLIRKKRPEASEVLFKLEDLLRYQINDSTKETVQLSSEIHFLNDFLKLEKIRRDKFDYVISKEGEINQVALPPMLFIPFVENAVKHNPDSENASYVNISFKIRRDKLEFICENSKPVIPVKKSEVGGLGLKNIQRRLDLLFPGRYVLEVNEDKDKYSVYLGLEI